MPRLGGLLKKFLGGLGSSIGALSCDLRHTAAVMGTVLQFAVIPGNWTQPVRLALVRQVRSVGIEPLGIASTVAVLVGISLVVQLTFWIGEAGQSQMLGPLLVAVVARELGPLLINFIVIVRSGSAMTIDLRIVGLQGGRVATSVTDGDPFGTIVVSRVLGMAVSTFCLTIVFLIITFFSGFLFAAWVGKGTRDIALFADSLSTALGVKDMLNILAKCLLPALFAGATCCVRGMGGHGTVEEIPGATQQALVRSVEGLFVISAVVSLLTYL